MKTKKIVEKIPILGKLGIRIVEKEKIVSKIPFKGLNIAKKEEAKIPLKKLNVVEKNE